MRVAQWLLRAASAVLALSLLAATPGAAFAQGDSKDAEKFEMVAIDSTGIDFGDDTSRWINDGECDDPRFIGSASDQRLLPEDEMHDATDCRAAFEGGTVRLLAQPGAAMQGEDALFGDNSSQWANDGECDDPRFIGSGAAENNVESDIKHDANDCRAAFEAGAVTLNEDGAEPAIGAEGIEFGDDSSRYALDGRCDDPRFLGTGADLHNVDADLGHDATDCRTAFETGTIAMQPEPGEDATPSEGDPAAAEGGETDMGPGEAVPAEEEAPIQQAAPPQFPKADASGIDFGSNDGRWTNDRQCDDPRFAGAGAAAQQDEADRMHDADDCRAAFEAGTVTLNAAPAHTGTTTAPPAGTSVPLPSAEPLPASNTGAETPSP